MIIGHPHTAVDSFSIREAKELMEKDLSLQM
jgi:hypothetical protein